MLQKQLFIMGVAESGPVRLWRLLKTDERLGLGRHRFLSHSWRDWSLQRSHYAKERFFDTSIDDPADAATLQDPNGYFSELQDRYDECEYVGDTLPLAFLQEEKLVESFPGAKILLVLRGIHYVLADREAKANAKGRPVDDQVNAAINEWNRSVRFALHPPKGISVLPVIYEKLFYNGEGLSEIYDFLDLSVSDDVELVLPSVIEYLEMTSNEAAPAASMDAGTINELSAQSGYQALLDQAVAR